MKEGINQGFTVVELLIAIVIAVMILAAGSQVYTVALTNSGSAQRRAKASNIAYDLLRQAKSDISAPCVASGPTTVTIPSPTGLPNGATATRTVSCPIPSTPNSSLVSVTVNYTNPEQRSVTRAIVTSP